MSNEDEKRSVLERKRNILMLMSQYLSDYGLANTNDILLKESCLLATANREFTLCDNVDLESIYLDYMSYHQLKFGRPPKVTKRSETSLLSSDEFGHTASKKMSSSQSVSSANNAARRKQQQFRQRSISLRPDVDNAKEKILQQESSLTDALVVSPLPGQPSISNDTTSLLESTVASLPLLRHHPHFSADWGSLADTICRDIVDGFTLTVCWDTIKGHHDAKEKLIESVLSPLLYPQLFAAGGLRPWKAVLLHGPPGTGKTSLARALCKEAAGKATFFNVSASSMVSKWRGDSEKLARVLFDVAKYYAPSIVFIDEVEGFMSKRDCSSEHEASKRFKNELLTHIDGLDEMRNVFVLGSTNLPWDLDPAFLRRFERKLFLTLPDKCARTDIIRELMPHSSGWTSAVWQEILHITDAFTGDEIRVAHKEAAMQIVRQTIAQSRELHSEFAPTELLRQITSDEFLVAVSQIKPASKALLGKYQLWHEEHGGA